MAKLKFSMISRGRMIEIMDFLKKKPLPNSVLNVNGYRFVAKR